MTKHPNEVTIDGDVAYIHLRDGISTIVDVSDLPFLSEYRWCAYTVKPVKNRSSPARVITNMPVGVKPSTKALPRVLLGISDTLIEVDHINCDPLDNRRSNLRICTRGENAKNREKPRRASSSKYKGVSLHRDSGRWMAFIGLNRRCRYIGSYKTDIDAAMAYDKAAIKIHGEFAKLNFPALIDNQQKEWKE